NVFELEEVPEAAQLIVLVSELGHFHLLRAVSGVLYAAQMSWPASNEFIFDSSLLHKLPGQPDRHPDCAVTDPSHQHQVGQYCGGEEGKQQKLAQPPHDSASEERS